MWIPTRVVSAAAVVMLVLGACGGEEGLTPAPTLGPGAETPGAAIEELVVFLKQPDFGAAASLIVPGQSALAALSEGATTSQVASALENGDIEIASNFWSGFAQGLGSLLDGEFVTGSGVSEVVDGVEFHIIELGPASGDSQRVALRDVDGWRIDLFASFGGTLAERMTPPVELLLTSSQPEATQVLLGLRDVVPSLKLALAEPGLSAPAAQALASLIEMATRLD